jgi:D-alanyl-D-alanine dipeptidase
MIFYKIKTFGLFLFLIFLFAQCANDISKPKIKGLTKNLVLHNLNPEYFLDYKQLTDSTGLLVFTNKLAVLTKMGDFFHFYTKSPFYVENINIGNAHELKNQTVNYFKLYINYKYKGKYKTTDTIAVRRKIASINILFLKTKNEYLTEGWKWKTIFKFIKQNSKGKQLLKPKINLRINDKQQLSFRAYRKRPIRSKKTNRLNRTFIKKYFQAKQFQITGFYQDKSSSRTIQYSISLDKSGSFRIYQIISQKVNKKLIKEIFLTGNWRCTNLYGNQVKLLLEGSLSGYFADKKEPIISNKSFRIKSILNGIELKSDNLLAKIYFDFPNDALVNIRSLIPDIVVDMPYAGTNNFTGVRLYPCNKCFLRYEVAKALINVQNKLKEKQMGLKLFDGYRPFSVQAIMFKKFPVPGYVADSIGGSVHNRGSAVDLTIIDKTGKELDMGTGFDELSRKANHTYLLFPDTVLKNRVFLKELMQACNFSPIRSEWWHYNYVDGRKFPKIDEPFLCD